MIQQLEQAYTEAMLQMDQLLLQLIAEAPLMQSAAQRLQSIKGIGVQAAVRLTALFTQIEFANANAVQEAITRWGTPAIFNTDQGSQFTSNAFTAQLKRHGIRISMDGKGAWRSIKYEEIYLKVYDSVRAAGCGIEQYLEFYNSKQPHQAHNQATPDEVYFAALPFAQLQAA